VDLIFQSHVMLRNFTNKEIIWSPLIVHEYVNSFRIYLQVPHMIAVK